MINWKIRFKNWLWVSGFVSQIMIIVQLLLVAANALGWTDFSLTEEIKAWVIAFANAIFIALSSLGLVQDPTVEGVRDSPRALKREEPLNVEKDRWNPYL
ncbi:phage holin [Cytobacillus depressus]|uniref:Phage holin n=1 Tax=Cytobacillus depressus TaxID=1602942 RepID=A0A6L3V4G5_9BACI|nr:phage holin [Cytobacillus depressus]KAB2328919.1 phage holin [Cytobacillus depressus]